MILPFSTKIGDKPTYFIEKIWEGLLRDVYESDTEYQQYLRLHKIKFLGYWDWIPDEYKRITNPKIHTLRDDEKDRWKSGKLIHFFINNQKSDMFQFAPVLPVVSTQEVFMTYAHSDLIEISIDDRQLFSYNERLEFALNDGFDSWEDFFKYFYPKITASKQKFYKGKLIHWTNLKY
ncbi:hypothetical protein [Flavobacterium aestivum]|uniref:hypothetical protein n=1 Tax=Flavobacterium aestivum TaxID=3003257 RepID=UPI002482EDB4|nr:hypothetical protein [Flavobacterium aestivum]